MNPRIDDNLEQFLNDNITDIHKGATDLVDRKWVNCPDWSGKWHSSRWIQVYTTLKTHLIHYEYLGGYVCLHLEDEYATKHPTQVRELKFRSRKFEEEIQWLAPDRRCISCIIRQPVNGQADLIRKFRRMVEIFETDLKEIFESGKCLGQLTGSYTQSCPEYNESETRNGDVSISTKSISSLFAIPLTIPEYQRIYCWENDQIKSLWDSLNEIKDSPYHLGTIILQERNKSFEVVDGQQRLVTLSLILWGLDYKKSLPLLNQRFKDSDAIKHVKNAKAVIQSLIWTLRNNDLINRILKHLQFSVITIKGENLDLAYTFFSNQNSKGVKLSDYDLLKAHHLRYISSEPQAKHLAINWSKLTIATEPEEEDKLQLKTSLGKHIYRLRHLLRKEDFNEDGHYIRDEFQAAPIMIDVPAFGENFDYYEPIQGGPHFFAFASHFNEKYLRFIQTPQIRQLRALFEKHHKVYEEMAEAILFTYYLKFETQYLWEAMFCTLTKLAEHRYSKVRALELQVHKYAQATNFVQLIQFSTSPTFFMASAIKETKTGIRDYDITGGIRWDFYKRICELFADAKDITVSEIQQAIENEYR